MWGLLTAGSAFTGNMQLWVDGVNIYNSGTDSSTQRKDFTFVRKLNAGESVTIRCGSSVTSATSDTQCFMSVHRIGF